MHSQDVLRYVKPCWDDSKYVKYEIEKENNMINKNCESFDKCMHVRGKGACDGCGNMFSGMFEEEFKKYVQLNKASEYARYDIDTLVKTHGYVTFKKPSNPFAIKNVIFNPPATIVFWEDGTKTVVKAGEHDMFDPEKGLAMAISKRALGGKHDYYEPFAKWVGKYEYQCKKQMRQMRKCEKAYADFLAKRLGKVEKVEVTDDGVRAEISTEDEWFSKWAKRYLEGSDD